MSLCSCFSPLVIVPVFVADLHLSLGILSFFVDDLFLCLCSYFVVTFLCGSLASLCSYFFSLYGVFCLFVVV